MTPDDWQGLIPEMGLRPVQFDALARIWAAYEDGAEVVLLEAPTGVGKSIIQLALCRKIAKDGGSSYVVTPQRALQDQMRGWDGTHIMKGRGQYSCRIMDGTAATAPCTVSPDIRQRQPECAVGACPFYTALYEAQNSKVVVHNYSSLMAQSIIGQHFHERDLLCLDEGHTAASWVRNFMTFEFTRGELRELSSERPPTGDAFIAWFIAIVESLGEGPTLNGISDDLKITLLRAKACKRSFGSVPWAVVRDEREDTWTMIPLRVSPIAWTLTNMGKRVMITSATILHQRLLVAELGMSQKKIAMVDIPSAFPPENRPIIRRYIGSMSKKARDKTMGQMVKEIIRIADTHRNEPGMIHTVSHALSNEIWEALRNYYGTNRYIGLLPQGGGRDAMIRDFLSGATGPSSILVGPSLMEGIDGKDDSCRWQVMCKAPFPNMGDPVVSDILSGDANAQKWGRAWYAWKTAQQAVQGFGRVCRTPTDHGVTYLLDSGFARVLNSGYIPGYVLDAVR